MKTPPESTFVFPNQYLHRISKVGVLGNWHFTDSRSFTKGKVAYDGQGQRKACGENSS